MNNRNIGIVGFGNMGQAIAGQLKTDYQIFAFDKDNSKITNQAGIKITKDVKELVNSAGTIIMAVKPQDFESALNEIKDYINLDKLIISIAAGISTGYIEKHLGNARVVRAMPNIPAKIGAGMTCISKGRLATEEDLDFSQDLFEYLGEVLLIEEGLMNAATAVSGSGPAYVCRFLDKKQEFLKDFKAAAMELGFNDNQAKLLVNTTFNGTVEFLKKTGTQPQELIKQVASKGGTTEAAFKVLDQGGSLLEAIKAARNRAQELSNTWL